MSRPVIWSRRFWVKTIVKTAWDLEDVSFMLVAATVLHGTSRQAPMFVSIRKENIQGHSKQGQHQQKV